jgi:hypothetical protein
VTSARGVLGAASAAAVVVTLVAGGCGGRKQTSPPPTPPPQTTAPTAVAPVISDLHTAGISPFSATIEWETAFPTAALVEAGPPDGPPTLWRHEARLASHHSLTLSGLAFATPYRVRVRTSAGEAALDLTTGPAPVAPRAAVHEAALWVDGSPFFPLMVFEQCPDTYDTSLQAGINLFAGNRCGGLPEARPALRGRALLAATADDDAADADGTVATFYPDEADGHDLTAATLPRPPPGGAAVRFLTLTSHFYSGAAPLRSGRTIYPGLVSKANAVGFDLYPLQGWCRPERLADVYYSQHELATGLARGKPTYQLIEASGMRCPQRVTAVTPATVRAESFLAIAGGAHGLGFFPAAAWTGDVGAAIAEVARAVRYLGPALLGPEVRTQAEPGRPVVASARAANDALYVIAVNPTYSPAAATITVRGLRGRPLTVFDEGRTVASSGDSFTDSFAPLAAHVYVARALDD